MNKKEYVMVFKKEILENIGYFEGITFNIKNYIKAIIDEKNYAYMLREKAEISNEYKQIIVYGLLKYKNQFLSYRRGIKLKEKRLFKKYSIGIGGHISTNDPIMFNTPFDQALKREISEEVYIKEKYSMKTVGMINDDSDSVGKVHIGIIYLINIQDKKVEAKEKSINEIDFFSIKKLSENIDMYENWSKICIENFHNLSTNI